MLLINIVAQILNYQDYIAVRLAAPDAPVNRFGPPMSSQPDVTRRIYLKDAWRTSHGNSKFPLNVKSLSKYDNFKANLENDDKAHECYYPVTNTAGGCLQCNADWVARDYLTPGPMDCGVNDTGWRPKWETTINIPDGKACPRAFFTNACHPRANHTPPPGDNGRTCIPERTAVTRAQSNLSSARSALRHCETEQALDPTIDCTLDEQYVEDAQDDLADAHDNLADCLNLPFCQWRYNPSPWSPWAPSRAKECSNQQFIQSSVRTLDPEIIGNPLSCRHTPMSLPPHSRERTVYGTRSISDADCGGGGQLPQCTSWHTGPWSNLLTDTEIAAQTCDTDTAIVTRDVTKQPSGCTGTPAGNRPDDQKIIQGTKSCGPVNGQCNNSAFSQCTAGTPINPDPVTNTWTCQGENGGNNSPQCQFGVPKDGLCDNSSYEGCTDGNPINANPNTNTWHCAGVFGGNQSPQCQLVEDGVCDNDNLGQCLVGTPIALIGNRWNCDGVNGGRTSSLCEYVPPTIVNGVCDTANFGQCTEGNPANENAATNTWDCLGDNGGTNAQCSITAIVHGECGEEHLNHCIAGTPTQTPFQITDNKWTCEGINGGNNALDCDLGIVNPPPPGQCGVDCPETDESSTIWLGTYLRWYDDLDPDKCRVGIFDYKFSINWNNFTKALSKDYLTCERPQCGTLFAQCDVGASAVGAPANFSRRQWYCITAGSDNAGDIIACSEDPKDGQCGEGDRGPAGVGNPVIPCYEGVYKPIEGPEWMCKGIGGGTDSLCGVEDGNCPATRPSPDFPTIEQQCVLDARNECVCWTPFCSTC